MQKVDGEESPDSEGESAIGAPPPSLEHPRETAADDDPNETRERPTKRQRLYKRRTERDKKHKASINEAKLESVQKKKQMAKAKRKTKAVETTPEPIHHDLFPFHPNTRDIKVPSLNIVEDVNLPQDQKDFLTAHHKLGHLSFIKMKKMAANGILPKKFTKCREPRCTECLYGKQTR